MNVDFNKLKTEFWENGYLILDEFFPADLMDEYQQIILDHFLTKTDWEHNTDFITKSENEVIPWFPYNEGQPYFDGIDKNNAFNTLTAHILKSGWDNLYCMMMFSKAGSKGQAWHQDCPPENPTQFNLNRLVYTHDITDETGGEIVIIPKSHRKGVLPAGVPHEDLENQLVFSPKKGTAIFLHGHCFHRVMPVKADRVSSNFRAIPKGVPKDITDVCVYRNMRYRFSTSEIIEERT